MGILNNIIVARLGEFPVGKTVDGTHIVLPDVEYLDILFGKVLDGVLGIACSLNAEELGTDYDIGAEVVGLLETVFEHVLEEECKGQQSTARAEATAIVGDRIAGVTAQVAVNLVVGKRPVKGALCPVVKDDGIDLTVNLLAVYLLVEISAVGCLDKRAAEFEIMCLGQRCIDVNRSNFREVAPAGLLGLVAVPAAEQQVRAESELEHVAGGVCLAAYNYGIAVGNIVCIFDNVFITLLGELPVGQTVDGAHMCGPFVDNLDVFLCEFLDGSGAGLGVLDLLDHNLKSVGNIAALDDHLTLTCIAGVGGAGNLEGNVAGLAGAGLYGNPAFGSSSGPCLLGGELGLFGLLDAVELEFAGNELDIGHIHTVEVVVEMNILDGIPNVLCDVVLEQVVVEADHDKEGTHSGDLSYVTVEVDRALACAEFLEVADGRRIECGAACQIPSEFVCKELDGTRMRLGEVDNLAAVVGVLIPRPLAPTGSDNILCGSRDRLVESLTVAQSMDERVAGRLHE